MLNHFFCRFSRTIKPSVACQLFNTRHLSPKTSRRLLAKSGVVFNGKSVIMAPFFYEFGQITLGQGVYINAGGVFLDNAPISIGDGSLIGPNVTLTTASHPVDPAQRHACVIAKPITIGENVWLGAGVVVLLGITIGNNSVIAANSVVNADVPENMLYAGAPARCKRVL